MKNFTLILLGVLLCTAVVQSETIDGVLYNPSRLGHYEHLKISDTLTSEGGLKTEKMVMTGQVTVQGSDNYTISGETEVKGSVRMSDTTFNVDTLSHNGGLATFAKASEIATLEGYLDDSTFSTSANSINAEASVYVKESLTLGGNKIPLNNYPSSCNGKGLTWVPHQVDGKIWQVLGFNGCTTTSKGTGSGNVGSGSGSGSGSGNREMTWKTQRVVSSVSRCDCSFGLTCVQATASWYNSGYTFCSYTPRVGNSCTTYGSCYVEECHSSSGCKACTLTEYKCTYE